MQIEIERKNLEAEVHNLNQKGYTIEDSKSHPIDDRLLFLFVRKSSENQIHYKEPPKPIEKESYRKNKIPLIQILFKYILGKGNR